MCMSNINIYKKNTCYFTKKIKLHVTFWISKNRSKLNRIYLDRIGSDFFNIIIQTEPNRT